MKWKKLKKEQRPEFDEKVLVARIGDTTQTPPPILPITIASIRFIDKDGMHWVDQDGDKLIGDVIFWAHLPANPIKFPIAYEN